MKRWQRIAAATVVFVLLLSGVVWASTGSQSIEVFYENIGLIVHGNPVTTADEPFIYNSRTYVPLRAVAEALGEDVAWDGNAKTVHIGHAPMQSGMAYLPVPGPITSTTDRPGWLRLQVPATTVYDHWATVDHAPQVRQQVPDGDWQLVGKYDLNAFTPGAPFQTGLVVLFGRYDAFYWGPYAGTNLRLERSGFQNLAAVPSLRTSGWLRIRKYGDTYYFDYRATEADAWVTAARRTSTTPPQYAGFMLKTWAPTAVTVDGDYTLTQP